MKQATSITAIRTPESMGFVRDDSLKNGQALRRVVMQKHVWILSLMGLCLVAIVVSGLAVGAVPISPQSVLAILISPLGCELPWAFSEREAMVVWHIRAPRVLASVIVGATLALGGALMQALFRNPLADPGLIGVSSGAAMAAAAFTVFSGWLPWLMHLPVRWVMPLMAFLGSWAVMLMVTGLARRLGQTRVDHLLLAGIAMNALAGSAIGVLMLVASDTQLREITFWSFGSLGRVDWTVLPVLGLALLPLLMASMRYAPWLDALLLGETEAAHLGVPVEQLKRYALILTCLAVGGAVAFTGLIGFVGLVVPHVVRLVCGPGHQRLIPASVLLGAALLPLADMMARTVVAPVELPIGLLTSLLGAPFFIFLLQRGHQRGDG